MVLGDLEILGEFGDDRDRLDAGPLKQVHGGGIPLKAFRQPVQALGDLHQDLGRGLDGARGVVQRDAHPLHGAAGFLAFIRGVVGGLR